MFTRKVAALASISIISAAAAQAAETVTIAMHYTEEQAAPLLACIAQYEAANPDTDIVYQQISYDEYLQTILTSRAGGTSPDIYNLYSIWGAQMVDNGLLAPAPVTVTAYLADQYLPDTVAAATIDETVWGIPTEVSAYMLVSNMKLLKAAGFDAPPTTWAELVEMSKAITTRDAQGRIGTAGFAFAKSSSGAGLVHPFYSLMYSSGNEIYADGYSAANLESAAAKATVAQMAMMASEGITDLSIDAYDFPAGGIAMMIMANWFKSDLKTGFGESFSDVNVSQIPSGKDWKTLQYAFYMGVDSNSPVKERAWDIVRWTNSPESAATEGGPSCMGQMMDNLGALTANRADREALGAMDSFTQPYWDALQEGRAISQPNVLQASEIERSIALTLETVIVGDAEPEAAMIDLDAQVEGILAEFY